MANIILVGLSPQVRGKRWNLEGQEQIVGRVEETSDICIIDSTISSRHARFVIDEDNCVLEDLGSTNGSKVNGEAIQSKQLQNGDIIQFGVVELMYKNADAGKTVTQKSIINLANQNHAGKTVRQMSNMSPIAESNEKRTKILFMVLGAFFGIAILGLIIAIFSLLLGK